MKVGCHSKLSQGYRSGTDVFGSVDTECNRKRLEPELTVSFDRFEVINYSDSKAGNGVEDGTVLDCV